MAREIIAGNIIGHSVFFMSPLYPYFLALLYSIFGYNLLLPRIFQIILGTTIPVLTYLIGMRFFDKKVASIAAFLSAFSGIMIFDEANLLLDHPLLTFLLLVSILLVLLAKNSLMDSFRHLLGIYSFRQGQYAYPDSFNCSLAVLCNNTKITEINFTFYGRYFSCDSANNLA